MSSARKPATRHCSRSKTALRGNHGTVPSVTIDGATDPLRPGGTAGHARMFVAAHEHVVTDAGHNVPQQAPCAFADAVIKAHEWVGRG